MTGDLLHTLDLRRKRAHDRARDAANPAERDEWERVRDDLDAATALVRRALRIEASIVSGEVEA
jgi:hypothetical protein